MTTRLATITGPADIRDQRWLDDRVEAARSGIEAVIDVALNWTEGRQVGRLHPGVAPADYIREHVGLVGREAIVPLLTESNWSNRQIAADAGVSHPTVAKIAAGTGKDLPVDRLDKRLGADGKLRRRSPSGLTRGGHAPRFVIGLTLPPETAEDERENWELDAANVLDDYDTFAIVTTRGAASRGESYRTAVAAALAAGREVIEATMKYQSPEQIALEDAKAAEMHRIWETVFVPMIADLRDDTKAKGAR